jgi:hypothetical protein
MKMLLAMCVLGASMLTGCSVYTPAGAVVVDDGPRHGPHHCPPGQAKKGRC